MSQYILLLSLLIVPFCFSIKDQKIFHPDFLFGVGTSSFQVEGGLSADGKGRDIWQDMVEYHPELITDESSPDNGPNSYYFFDKDLKIIKELGVDFYRFSISWARILPTGDISSLNPAGINYYNQIINGLIKNGIKPMVTMNHFDLPSELQKIGGYTNPVFIDYAVTFADLLFCEFGDRVKLWITFNEPALFCDMSYGLSTLAPRVNGSSVATYLCGDSILKAHANIYHLYKEKYYKKQQGSIGIALNSYYYYSQNNDRALVKRALEFELGWFANPIYSETGGYPDIMVNTINENSAKEGRLWSRLPELSPYWKDRIKGSADFLGFNYYSSFYVMPGNTTIINKNPTWQDDLNVTTFRDAKCNPSDFICNIPEGLKDILHWIKQRYNNVPVIITENGFGDDGRLDDAYRVQYLGEHLAATYSAIKDGCNVIGYSSWSLIDNFEWTRGFTLKFGLYSVNLTSPYRERIAKSSGKYYQLVIQSKRLVPRK